MSRYLTLQQKIDGTVGCLDAKPFPIFNSQQLLLAPRKISTLVQIRTHCGSQVERKPKNATSWHVHFCINGFVDKV